MIVNIEGMTKHHNLLAYESYELIDGMDELSEYRDLKLRSCDKHIELLRMGGASILDVLELGSGNSKLLVNLSLNGMLRYGYGIEISRSRHDFAQRWVDDLGISNIENINADIIGFDFGSLCGLDVCICVDLCFQFFDPISKGSDRKVLDGVYGALKEGGKLILELDGCGSVISNLPHTAKVWEEFPDTDPWRYSLWDCAYDSGSMVLDWGKTFISRKGEIEETSISLRIYDRDGIEELLNKVGFRDIKFYKDWSLSEFDCDYGEFIVIAEK